MSSSPPLVVADRYRLVSPLGQGGMGRVWRATDVVLHREVAIKELVPPPGLTPAERQEMRERSLREARAIARLNNINVVRVFDVLSTDADPWIVMEYVPSRSLQDTLAEDGPFNPVRAAERGLGVLGALRAAHRAGVVHRDVKPGNVLIGADGRVVLTDFGLATVPGDPNVTRTGLVLGSPAYIAPERARDGTAGPAADLWSLGATLYATVEGASPFARPSAIATLAALATENPPPARNAGPLKPVLNGLLRKDPAHRINAEEAERLLLRATGKRSRMSFPMSPTMRRPGVGRERPALPGNLPTGSTPVVPGPRSRPAVPPVQAQGQVPPATGRAQTTDGRPPVFIPGKASVGRPAPETPTRVDNPKVDAPRLDATRIDGPAVRDEKPVSGTRPGAPTAPGRPPAAQPPRSGPPSPAQPPRVGPPSPTAPQRGAVSRTTRGEAGAFTAADVAAYRRKTAAPEHERSLADATAVVSPIEAPPTESPVPVDRPRQADATTLLNAPPPDATTVVNAPAPDATTLVSPATPPATRKPAVSTPAATASPAAPTAPPAARPSPTAPTTKTPSPIPPPKTPNPTAPKTPSPTPAAKTPAPTTAPRTPSPAPTAKTPASTTQASAAESTPAGLAPSESASSGLAATESASAVLAATEPDLTASASTAPIVEAPVTEKSASKTAARKSSAKKTSATDTPTGKTSEARTSAADTVEAETPARKSPGTSTADTQEAETPALKSPGDTVEAESA
ncbi:MAG: protein kinase, partial [Actinoplanes sp.]